MINDLSSLTMTSRQRYQLRNPSFDFLVYTKDVNSNFGTLFELQDITRPSMGKCNEFLEITGVFSYGEERGASARAREYNGKRIREYARRGSHRRAYPRAVPPIDILHRRIGSQDNRLFQSRYRRQWNRRTRDNPV